MPSRRPRRAIIPTSPIILSIFAAVALGGGPGLAQRSSCESEDGRRRRDQGSGESGARFTDRPATDPPLRPRLPILLRERPCLASQRDLEAGVWAGGQVLPSLEATCKPVDQAVELYNTRRPQWGTEAELPGKNPRRRSRKGLLTQANHPTKQQTIRVNFK